MLIDKGNKKRVIGSLVDNSINASIDSNHKIIDNIQLADQKNEDQKQNELQYDNEISGSDETDDEE